jgi:hypothetical protein
MAQAHDEYGHTVEISGTVGLRTSLQAALRAPGAGKNGGTWDKDAEPYASMYIRTNTGTIQVAPHGDTAANTAFILGESGAQFGPFKYDEPPTVVFSDTQTVYINLIYPNGGR